MPDGRDALDARDLLVTKTVPLGGAFRYVFDLDDWWVHRCTVGPGRVDPLVEVGRVPDVPRPSFGWGSLPDQHGRRWDGDGVLTEQPPPPEGPDPMLGRSWPQPGPARMSLTGGDLAALRGATSRGPRHAVARPNNR